MKASAYPISAGLSPAAHALRPMRIDREGDAVHYEAVSYVGESRKGCELQIRRMECFGMLTKREGQLQGNWFLDVLDAGGAGYSVVQPLADGSLGVLYEAGDYDAIVFRRVTRAAFDRGLVPRPGSGAARPPEVASVRSP